MKSRNIALQVIFTIVTVGIYGIYWFYTETNDTHEVLGRENSASGGMSILFTIITFGIYGLYWYYKMGDGISEALSIRGMRTDGHENLIYLVLALFGFGIVSNCLLQDKLNDIIAFDSANGVPQPYDNSNPYSRNY